MYVFCFCDFVSLGWRNGITSFIIIYLSKRKYIAQDNQKTYLSRTIIYLVHINANSLLRFLFLDSWNSLFRKQILLGMKTMIQWFASEICQGRQFKAVFPPYLILVMWHKRLTYSMLVCSVDLVKLITLTQINWTFSRNFFCRKLKQILATVTTPINCSIKDIMKNIPLYSKYFFKANFHNESKNSSL